jgi:hypothetical protein
MSEPIIVSPRNIPHPDRPGEVLPPSPPTDGKTSILVIFALALGAYGIYRMVQEDKERERELENDEEDEEDEEDEYEDEYEDEDDDGGPPDTGPFSGPDTGPVRPY